MDIKKDPAFTTNAGRKDEVRLESLFTNDYNSPENQLQRGIARCRQVEHILPIMKDVRKILEDIRDESTGSL